jgi:MFS family permease
MQICIISLVLFFAFSIGTALAPNLAAFFIFRLLTAFQGTCLLIVGASVIGDMFKPVRQPAATNHYHLTNAKS